MLGEYVDALPCGGLSPIYPFLGWVMNMNSLTLLHHDWLDEGVCMILAIFDGEGGELGLMEPGIILELRNGDVVIFPSSQISHFNMHYRGCRAALVFHSDKSTKGWLEDRNGWDHNIYFRSSNSNNYLI